MPEPGEEFRNFTFYCAAVDWNSRVQGCLGSSQPTRGLLKDRERPYTQTDHRQKPEDMVEFFVVVVVVVIIFYAQKYDVYEVIKRSERVTLIVTRSWPIVFLTSAFFWRHIGWWC